MLKKRLYVVALFLVVFATVAGCFTVYALNTISGPVRYVVKNDDTLNSIASKYGVTIDTLKQTNTLKSDSVTTGQVLKVPVAQYIVKYKDTLYSIAVKNGIALGILKQANNLKSDFIAPGQILAIPDKMMTPSTVKKESVQQVKSLKAMLLEKGISDPIPKLSIVVDKSDHTLILYSGSTQLKSYHVELGDSGLGDKQVEGDHKTPEGTLYIAEKSVLNPADQYLGTRWMRLSYPNIEDGQRGLQQGLIDRQTYNEIVNAINNKSIPPQDTPLGGGVGIHGGSTQELGKDWTWGCVGLTSKDVEDFYNYVSVGTPVIIQK